MKKEKLFKCFFWLLPVVLFLIVFKAWLSPTLIFGGDFYFPPFKEEARELPSFPYAWNQQKGNGLGGYVVSTLWIDTYAQILPISLIKLGMPGFLVQKLVFLFPFLFFSFFSGIFLFKTLFPQEKKTIFLVPIIFGLNSYILMLVGGGQMGIGLAYALAPLVLGLFIKLTQTLETKYQILAGLTLAFQVLLDLRLALLTMGIFFLYFLFQFGLTFKKKYLKVFSFPFLITFGLHAFWLLPAMLIKKAALPAGYGEQGWVEFLSFSNFSDSFSLLHPNWPENIFGKTYFMRPEFLVIPILAFISLLFISRLKDRQTKKKIFFLAILGLIGAFLAKGAKPPFGGVYLWFFNYLPGMSAFRDPTKFYLFTALSYSLLIPFSLGQILNLNQLKKRLKIQHLALGLFVIYWLFIIQPAWLGQLNGIFKTQAVPQEYKILKDFIHNQDEFFRTLWIPKRQTFAFYTSNHPAVESPELLSAEQLDAMGVKYIIIPFDSEERIFLEDRQYDYQQRLDLEGKLDEVSWLKKIEVTDKIAVYETSSYQDHFSVAEAEASPINWTMVNPTKYLVRVSGTTQPFNLIFSETYDELWQARVGERIISSERYDFRQASEETIYNSNEKRIIEANEVPKYNSLNSFSINQTGDFEITIEYVAQKYVYYGLLFSVAVLLAAFSVLVYSLKKQ